MIENYIYLVGQFINTVGQIILFSSIPFLWYIVSKRRVKGVFNYLGLRRNNKQNYIKAFEITSLVYIFSLAIIFILKFTQEDIYLNPLKGSFDRGVIIFIISLILFGLQTGISEEIFFRGFIGKRSIDKFGFLRGNILQTMIFMTPHMFTFSRSNILEFILLVINSAIIGFTFGYIMDKKSDGSILPVIICHGIINIVSSIVLNII